MLGGFGVEMPDNYEPDPSQAQPAWTASQATTPEQDED